MTFYKEIDYNNRDEMIDFLKNHYRYPVNNGPQKTYAQNVKLHQLDLPEDVVESAYNIIAQSHDFYHFAMEPVFNLFEEEHGNVEVGTAGRSGGYILLYKKGFKPIEIYTDFENWDDENLSRCVKLLQDFDRMCDNLVDELIDWSRRYDVVEETVMVPQKRLVLVER